MLSFLNTAADRPRTMPVLQERPDITTPVEMPTAMFDNRQATSLAQKLEAMATALEDAPHTSDPRTLRQIDIDLLPPEESGQVGSEAPGDGLMKVPALSAPSIPNNLFTPFTKDKYDMATLSRFGYNEQLYDPNGSRLRSIVLKLMRQAR